MLPGMEGLEEVTVKNREGGSDGAGKEFGDETNPNRRGTARRRRPKNRRNTNNSGNSDEDHESVRDSLGDADEEGAGVGDKYRQRRDVRPTTEVEDARRQFYKVYHGEAEEYDLEFRRRYGEELNINLVPAGLLSAVTSAFSIYVHPQLKPDPNEETAALLRVLLYKLDNATFGGDVPTVPQWSGAPRAIIQVQAILYASLSASILSALLAMLGKHWLNQYASIDLRGSAAERNRNRQRKFDGVVNWRFDYVMELSPLLLQVATLFLGVALSRYLMEIDTTIGSVVLGFTSFSIISYLFATIVGSTSADFPYPTPGSRVLRSVASALASATVGLSYLRSDRRTTLQDWSCVSWLLRTSQDGHVQLAAIRFLTTSATLANFKPSLVEDCFNVFISCVTVIDQRAVVVQGLEELAESSALSLLRMVSHLLATDPTSGVLMHVHWCYNRIFSPRTDVTNLPFYHSFGVIHRLLNAGRSGQEPRHDWQDYKPSRNEHAVAAQALAELVQSEYRCQEKVPRWIVHFALHSLSLNRLPSNSVVVDCLSVIAVDLGCDISSARTAALDESLQLEEVLSLITRRVEVMVGAGDLGSIRSSSKALTALFPYAVWQERDGRHELFDTLLHAARASRQEGFMWHRIEPLFTTLLNEGSPVSVKRAVILASPHLPWQKFANGERAVQLWAAAASAVPYSDAVCQSVSETLLQIAFDDILRPHIPVRMWSWLNKRPILPPVSKGRLLGSSRGVVRMVRGLGDVETLTSCLVLVWSEWNSLHPDGLDEIHASIREDFSGTRMRHHRKALLQRLDRVLGQVDLGLEHLQQQNSELNGNDIRQMKDQYGRLKEVILEVERDAIDEPIYARYHPAFMCAIPLPCQ